MLSKAASMFDSAMSDAKKALVHFQGNIISNQTLCTLAGFFYPGDEFIQIIL
jgi:hypothetical protein